MYSELIKGLKISGDAAVASEHKSFEFNMCFKGAHSINNLQWSNYHRPIATQWT